MSERHDLWRDIRSDEDAKRALAELGPLLHRKEQVETETFDPTFREDLRARLVTAAAERGDPATGRGPGIPAWTVRRNRWPA